MRELKDYFSNTRECIDQYNEILDQIQYGEQEISNAQEEILDNQCLYLAHALLKDYGPGASSRSELNKMCNIIIDVLRDDSYINNNIEAK